MKITILFSIKENIYVTVRGGGGREDIHFATFLTRNAHEVKLSLIKHFSTIGILLYYYVTKVAFTTA